MYRRGTYVYVQISGVFCSLQVPVDSFSLGIVLCDMFSLGHCAVSLVRLVSCL